MTTQPNKEGMQLRSAFSNICDTLSDLADHDESDLNFDHGVVISHLDNATMRISYDSHARQGFWKPYAKDAKIEAALEDHEEEIEDIEHEFGGTTQTVADAYTLSIKYGDFLWGCLSRAVLYNPVFGGEAITLNPGHGVGEGSRPNSASHNGPSTFEQIW